MGAFLLRISPYWGLFSLFCPYGFSFFLDFTRKAVIYDTNGLPNLQAGTIPDSIGDCLVYEILGDLETFGLMFPSLPLQEYIY